MENPFIPTPLAFLSGPPRRKPDKCRQFRSHGRKVNRNNESRVGMHQRPKVRFLLKVVVSANGAFGFLAPRFMHTIIVPLSRRCVDDAVVVCSPDFGFLPSFDT